ncbi:MAG: hypothetical protein GY937_16635 [bacterium]|nr:hypothetical protein [bacterium]
MTTSYTFSETDTFTITHARHMAAKVAADLKRLQRFYGQPSDAAITAYQDEVTQLLREGYLGTVTYGFRRDGAFIEPSLRYTAHDLAGSTTDDDDPGRVRPGADTSGATFYSYLTYSAAWDQLSSADQQTFESKLPITRGSAPEPAVNGVLRSDRIYSAGGRSLDRQSVKAS